MSEASAAPSGAGEASRPLPSPEGQAAMAKAYQPRISKPRSMRDGWRRTSSPRMAPAPGALHGGALRGHHAAAQCHRRPCTSAICRPAPPRRTSWFAGRACRAARRSGCQASTTPRSPPQWVLRRVLADEGVTPEELGRERRTWSACGASWRDPPGHHGPSSGPPGHLRPDWGRERFTTGRRARHGPCVSPSSASMRTGSLLPRQEARQLVPGLRTSVSDLEVIGTPETGRCGRSAHCYRRGGAPGTERAPSRPSPWPHATGDHPGRHGRGVHRRSTLRDPRRSARAHPFVDRDVPIIADGFRRTRLRHRRGERSHSSTRPHRLRQPASATACRASTS